MAAQRLGLGRLATGRAGRQDRNDRGDLLVVGHAATNDPQQRLEGCRLGRGLVGGHSGMFPCFFGGSDSRLVRSSRSARITSRRVSDGLMTASM